MKIHSWCFHVCHNKPVFWPKGQSTYTSCENWHSFKTGISSKSWNNTLRKIKSMSSSEKSQNSYFHQLPGISQALFLEGIQPRSIGSLCSYESDIPASDARRLVAHRIHREVCNFWSYVSFFKLPQFMNSTFFAQERTLESTIQLQGIKASIKYTYCYMFIGALGRLALG